MKKVIVLAVCIALLACAAFAGVRLYENRQTLSTAREKLCLEWDKYLAFRDSLDGIQLWTLGYVEDYLEQRSWESLVRARAAVAAGREALKEVEAPKLELDKEVKDALGGRLDELTLVTESVSAAALELQTMRLFFTETAYSLEDFFLYETELVKLGASVSFYQEDLPLTEGAIAGMTNWLYLQWNMQDRWAQMQAAYPSLASFCGPWEKDGGKLEARTDALLDAHEKLVQESQSRLLFSESMLADMEETVLSGNTQALLSQMAMPAGAPAVYPAPSWTQEPSATYYGRATDEGIDLVHCGDDLSSAPTSAYYYYDYVTREECDSYCDSLEALGYLCYGETNEDGSRLILVLGEDGRMGIHWSPYETTLILSAPMVCMLSPLDYSLLMQ